MAAMRAVTVVPGVKDSLALTDMPEPPLADGPVLVETQVIGICGTDLEIVNAEYGSPPPGDDRLILGHESLGRVVETPAGTDLLPGDLVAGIVRRRDPVPCPACSAGDWDMCSNGLYTERGIKARHGFASERFRSHPGHLVKVDPALEDLGVLLEPTSVVAKAWDHIERIGRRSTWAPRKVLVTGAGPIGLLAALLSTQRGFETFVFDRATSGHKPDVVNQLGATYHHGDVGHVLKEADIVIECTGFVELILDSGIHGVHNRITCLTGVSPAGAETTVDTGLLNRRMVLQNGAVFGSVNANRRHYELAADALANADPGWLAQLVTRRVPIHRWSEAYARRPDDIKTTLHFSM
jgi:glucose 1-dehydrogenase